MVRRYLRGWSSRGWGWGLRTHHVVGAGFLASAIGAYPIAASLGLAPKNLSSAIGWYNTAAPTIEGEVESATKDPTEYSKTLPGKIVSAVETLGAQAAAANGISLNSPTTAPPSFGSPNVRFTASGKPSGAIAPTAYPSAGPPTVGYPQAGYANAYPNGYPPAGYPTNSYPPGYQTNYTAGYTNPYAGTGDIACYFSPTGGCTEACVNEIRQAQQQILVQAYSFTSVPIANALVEAHNRGVAVYIVLDKSQKSEQYSSADFVAHAGIPTLIDSAHAIAHNKIMLIDRQTIITGSFNFTTSAEKSNAENLLVIRNRPDLYQAYENNFRHHYEHSQPYQGRGTSSQNHSYMPASNYGPSGYQQPGGHQHAGNYQYAGGYQQPSGYQQLPGYQQPSGYQQAPGYQQPNGYPPSNAYNYGGNAYPQTASPVYPSGGNRY